ncbi:hypothetical protein QBC46DRAFT_256641 [Diplogelasinospora grovesii]|uniref:Cell wall biogenesis protein Mhp1 n=1 Tax=Diplogelasinospora grovesii TaxID=303347 RepID=A0AAN6NAN6_9PEZI|nr:hypothetical protein QBC46DRAFT_256641 [Diplogelasinospora grovesii]
MEHIHGVDVSWMTHGSPKDKITKGATKQRSRSQSQQQPQQARDSPAPSPGSPASTPPPPNTNGTRTEPVQSTQPANPTPPKIITPTRPGFTRNSNSSDEKRLSSTPPTGTSPQRRGSWFSNISSKFSGNNANNQSPPQTNNTSPKPAELSVPKANPVKNAVLQHATKHEGEGPYTPAPPKSSQAGILHVFRRLSSSGGGLGPSVKTNSHGLVERRVLNVDRHRERCAISGLNQAKLRRVAFCVDVEIAPLPKYGEPQAPVEKRFVDKSDSADKTKNRKIKEKGEGEALKHPRAVECQKEEEGEIKATGEQLPREPPQEGSDAGRGGAAAEVKDAKPAETSPEKAAHDAKKRDKKKKSEEERKARKEKKRKLAEANGTIPMEIHLDLDSDSSSGGAITPRPATPRTQAQPTTNPVRIYRRCCQLRETPILKKITEQLLNPVNTAAGAGMVERLDLTGYWMQLADLVTLGDYLAVVPVKELVLENCGLTDEGLRVILAGLLAARKAEARRRRTHTEPDGLTEQGGVIERLVLKNNTIGPEGWKHICLFVYLCRTLKSLDLSAIPFPQPTATSSASRQQMDICRLLSKSLGERLGGSMLGLLSLGETGLSTEQLGLVIDGVIKCGVQRLGIAHNDIDDNGVQHVARFLRSGICEGLDLGGNDLQAEQLAVLAEALTDDHPLWALSLAECNLTPSSLCKLLPKLVKLQNFRFIDLSHNHELFNSKPSAISTLRRYLPKMACLKRIHLADCALSSEQVIALAEILPEITSLAHVSFMENPELVELTTNADTEERQEEACALFASLLAAARVSTSLVAVDIEVPSEQSSELVKAMAKQVVAYCLRNLERLPLPMSESATAAVEKQQTEASAAKLVEPEYPDVLQHLVGHDVLRPADPDSDVDAAPDDDYIVGGTGVVKALACCLKNNRGDESRRQSGEFVRDVENGTISHRSSSRGPKLPSGKAKETSKHLLSSARKIRTRLQPAIIKAKAASSETHTYHRLIFLDNTLKGIIKRFEDEFPDTREATDSAISIPPSPGGGADQKQLGTSFSSADVEAAVEAAVISDNEDEVPMVRTPALSRSNSYSVISSTSKALANEEGRVLRAGHKFRTGILKPEHYNLLAGLETIGADPKHAKYLDQLLEELDDELLRTEMADKGAVRVFQERKEYILEKLREADPVHWERFVESQEMARANVSMEPRISTSTEESEGGSSSSSSSSKVLEEEEEEEAVED